MKYLDLGLQGTVLVLTLAFLPGMEELALLLGAVAIGAIQLLSAVVSVIARGTYWKWKLAHLLLSITYFVVAFMIEPATNLLSAEAADVIGVGIPIMLAVYYFILTIMTALVPAKKGSKFLPHISF